MILIFVMSQLNQTLGRLLKPDSFFIKMQASERSSLDHSSIYHVVSSIKLGDENLELAIWKPTKLKPECLPVISSRVHTKRSY